MILISIISLSIWGFNFGIDFQGGTLMELKFTKPVDSEQIKEVVGEFEFIKNPTVQKTGKNIVLIRSKMIDKEQGRKIKSVLNEKVGEYEEIRLESVGPTITKNLTSKTKWALLIASIAIILYIAFAFRGIPKPANSWRFGITAIITLIHDLLIVVGTFVILGHFFGYEINSLFITALLTILGYSVNDTIVIFDRIRENLQKHPSKSFAQNTNSSINQTIVRSLNTSFTTLIVLLSVLIIGGTSIKQFIIALIIGVIIGTYSSIFIASPILVTWQNLVDAKSQKNRQIAKS